jgi:hypothetical protein
MYVPEAVVLDLGEHEFIRWSLLVGQTKDFGPALDEPDLGVADYVRRQINPNLVGAIDIVIDSVSELLEPFSIAVPPTTQAEFRDEHSDPAADVNAFQERFGITLCTTTRHFVDVHYHVIDRMVGRDCAKARFRKRPEKNLFG